MPLGSLLTPVAAKFETFFQGEFQGALYVDFGSQMEFGGSSGALEGLREYSILTGLEVNPG